MTERFSFPLYLDIDVHDMLALRAADPGFVVDEHGESLGMMQTSDEAQVKQMVLGLVHDALAQAGPGLGFHFAGGGTAPRSA